MDMKGGEKKKKKINEDTIVQGYSTLPPTRKDWYIDVKLSLPSLL